MLEILHSRMASEQIIFMIDIMLVLNDYELLARTKLMKSHVGICFLQLFIPLVLSVWSLLMATQWLIRRVFTKVFILDHLNHHLVIKLHILILISVRASVNDWLEWSPVCITASDLLVLGPEGT